MPNADRRLAGFAVAFAVGHHVGTLFGPLGGVGSTYWADWIDLVVPYAVLGFAASVLLAARAARTAWILLGLGGLAYTQGHGIHLAANSIARVAPGEPAHLWDEVVGHWVWHTGLAIVVAGLALALRERPLTRSSWAYVLASLFGVTVFTNAVEGGTVVLALATSVGFLVWGARSPGRVPWLLVPAYGVALAALIAWGVYWRGFPQFSELGWL